MFLLKAIQDKCYEEGADDDVAFVFFNVKGKDLLAIDQPADFDSEEDKQRVHGQYEKLGLTMLPFRNVKYYYPYSSPKTGTTYSPKEAYEEQRINGNAKLYKYA